VRAVKYSSQTVAEIREDFARGMTGQAIAVKYGISARYAYCIVEGTVRPNDPGPISTLTRQTNRRQRRLLIQNNERTTT
jgi:hypothetical protein